MIISIVAFILVITVIIVAHEFGHYITAKFFKIGVKEFAVGFGNKIFGIKWGETEYTLRPIPVGGFVDIEGMDASETDEIPDGFHKKPLLVRMSVLVAGPAMNFVIAALFFFIIDSFVGVQTPMYTKMAIVGDIMPDTAASACGIQVGDKILKINDQKIGDYLQFQKVVKSLPGKEISLEIERFGEVKNLKVTLGANAEGNGFFGIGPGAEPIVGQVKSKSPAELAGIEPDDKILKINDLNVEVFEDIRLILNKYTGQPVNVTYEKSKTKEVKTAALEPEIIDKEMGPMIGVGEKFYYGEPLPIHTGIISGVYRTWFYTEKMVEYLVGFITRRVSSAGLSGPVGIAREIGNNATDLGMLMTITAIISINIGLINLLPFPALDGGRLIFLILEALRGGKRVSTKVEEIIHTTGLALLIILMLFVTYKDILKLIKT